MFQSGILRTRLIGVSAFALVVIGGCEDGVGQGNDAAVLDGGPTDGPMVELDGSVPDEDAGRREGDGGESDAGVCECTCTHYVSPDGTAGGDGSEGSPWSLAHAAAMASPGDTVCVAAGDYGDTSLRLDTSGEPDRPIRFVGYRATPFDIELPTDHSTFVRGDAPDAATMPLLDGGDGTGDAIVINGDHIVLESLQIRRYDMGVRIHGDFVTLDNVIVSEQGNLSSASSYSGFGIFVFGDDVTLRRCFVEDAGAEGIKASGALRPVIRFTEVFAENASNPMDYYLLLTGDTRDALVEDSIVYRTPGLEHGGHGFTIKDQGTGNVFRRCHAFHTSLELNFGGVTGNTFEDCTLQGRDTSPGAWPAAIAVNNGAHDNLFRNIRVRDVWTAISFRDYDDGYTGPGGDRDLEATGIDNRFVNLVIEHANRIVGVTAGDPSFAAETRGNHFTTAPSTTSSAWRSSTSTAPISAS